MDTLKIRPLICLPTLTDSGKIRFVHNSPACQHPINVDRECAEKLLKEITMALDFPETA